MDLYPANAQDMQDPLLALLEDYNKGDLESRCRQHKVVHNRVKLGGIVRLSLCLTLATVAKTPVRWEIQNARKRRGIANSSPSALSDRERGQYEGVHDAQ